MLRTVRAVPDIQEQGMSSITCYECLFDLSDYLDQTASSDLLRNLEMHLSACPACFVIMDSTRQIIRLFRETQSQELPEHLHARLMKVIEHRIGTNEPIRAVEPSRGS